MKNLLILLTFLAGYIICPAQDFPGPASYMQELPGTLNGIPMGEDARTVAEKLEKAGFEKHDLASEISKELSNDTDVSNILSAMPAYHYCFTGKYMGKDGCKIFLLVKNDCVFGIGVSWEPESTPQLYKEIHDILTKKYADYRDYFSYDGYIKGLTEAQVMKYLNDGNNVCFKIRIPSGDDPMFDIIASPRIMLQLTPDLVNYLVINPLVIAMAN